MTKPTKVPEAVWERFCAMHFAGYGDEDSLSAALDAYDKLLLGDEAVHATAEKLHLVPAADMFDHQKLLKERAMRCTQAAIDSVRGGGE